MKQFCKVVSICGVDVFTDTDSTHVNKMDGGESNDDLNEREGDNEESEVPQEAEKETGKRAFQYWQFQEWIKKNKDMIKNTCKKKK